MSGIRAYTALYASPQQKKFCPADKRDDVYALGVLWYQLLRGDLTLERPSGEGWKRWLKNSGVTDATIALLNRCWDDEPEDRPRDGNELAALLALRSVLRVEPPIETPRPSIEKREPGLPPVPAKPRAEAAKKGGAEKEPRSVEVFDFDVAAAMASKKGEGEEDSVQRRSPEAETDRISASATRKPRRSERREESSETVESGKRSEVVPPWVWLVVVSIVVLVVLAFAISKIMKKNEKPATQDTTAAVGSESRREDPRSESKKVEPPKPSPKSAEPQPAPKKPPEPKVTISFEKDVKPILMRYCGDCHGNGGKLKGDVDLRTLAAITNPKNSPILTAGKPEKSAMYTLIAEKSMPPDGKPGPGKGETDLIREWILGGAKPRRRTRC